MLARLLDFLFPPCCPGCSQPFPGLCPACREPIRPVTLGLEGLASVRAAGLYQGPLKATIRELKFRARLSHVQALASLLEPPAGLLVPVPSPGLRRHLRGFNLPELLVRALGRPWQSLLACPPSRRQQKRLGLEERLRNANFHATGPVEGPVVLVDDLLTTGATLISCARALRQAGAGEVRAVVAACQPRRGAVERFTSEV